MSQKVLKSPLVGVGWLESRANARMKWKLTSGFIRTSENLTPMYSLKRCAWGDKRKVRKVWRMKKERSIGELAMNCLVFIQDDGADGNGLCMFVNLHCMEADT